MDATRRVLLRRDSNLNALRHRDDFHDFAKSVGAKLPVWAPKPRMRCRPIEPRRLAGPLYEKPMARDQTFRKSLTRPREEL